MSEFKNKTVLITGASSGIGEACALLFSQLGANLVLTARRSDKLEKVADECKRHQVEVETYALDLALEESVTELFSKLKKLDIAINNAGTEGALGDITNLSLKDYDTVMDLNVRATWLCLKHEIQFFRQAKRPGVIINMSSIAGDIAIPSSSLYVASKHAVNGLTKTLAVEQAPFGIRINAVSPGAIATPMLARVLGSKVPEIVKATPAGRTGSAFEIAQAVQWLASEKSSFVVGHCLTIDGGKTL